MWPIFSNFPANSHPKHRRQKYSTEECSGAQRDEGGGIKMTKKRDSREKQGEKLNHGGVCTRVLFKEDIKSIWKANFIGFLFRNGNWENKVRGHDWNQSIMASKINAFFIILAVASCVNSCFRLYYYIAINEVK